MIHIGKKGRIIKSELNGQFILVQETYEGIFIFMCKSRDFKAVFDDWVADRDSLEKYFREREWEIEWLD